MKNSCRFNVARGGLAALLALSFVAGCPARRPNESSQCVFNGDCLEPLLCAAHYCRAQCTTDRDCFNGICSPSDQPNQRVCLPPNSPALCADNSNCPANAVCATGNVCRLRCGADADCGGGTCDAASRTCNRPVFVGAVSSSDAGAPDAGPADASAEGGAGEAGPEAAVCDAATQTDPRNCGACGRACADGAHGVAACSMGACALTCEPNYGDCAGGVADGCETDLRASVAHCGACGFACPTRANATATCGAQGCGFTCMAGFQDCDGSVATGCEADVSMDRNNCGACYNRCGASQVCASGRCVDRPSCDGGVSGSDPLNCGGCGVVCPTRPNTTPACAMGVCSLSCAPGFGNCNGMMADGCETPTLTDTNCGACGMACAAGLTCVAGACVTSPMMSSGAEGDFAPTADVTLTPGVHHFRTITIPLGVTVRVSGRGEAELWATGDVVINGTVDVSGGNGGNGIVLSPLPPGNNGGGGETGTTVPGAVGVGASCAVGGAGGSGAPGGFGGCVCSPGGSFGGGAGGRANTGGGGGGGYAGGGGGGIQSVSCAGGDGASAGGGAGGAGGQAADWSGRPGGAALGAPYSGGPASGNVGSVGNGGGGSIGASAAADLAVASTFRAGSGGGGGAGLGSGVGDGGGAGGGGGGGALRIVSPTSITLGMQGALRANGGNGGTTPRGGYGGGGSGGVLYLVAPALDLRGTLSAAGGTVASPSTSYGGLGRIRLSVDPRRCSLTGSFTPGRPGGCDPSPAGGLRGLTYIGQYPN